MFGVIGRLLLKIQPELALFLCSMAPFVELRGGILLGTALGMSWVKVLCICIMGNLVPIPFLILFGRYTMDKLAQTKKFGNIVNRYRVKLIGRSEQIHKYGILGLILFVGIPLPGTGAWSGALIAVLLDLRMKLAVPAILTGVILAGIIMTIGSQGVIGIFNCF